MTPLNHSRYQVNARRSHLKRHDRPATRIGATGKQAGRFHPVGKPRHRRCGHAEFGREPRALHPTEAGQHKQQPKLRHAHLAVKYPQALQRQPDKRPRHQLKRRHGIRLGIPDREIVYELKYCICEYLAMANHECRLRTT